MALVFLAVLSVVVLRTARQPDERPSQRLSVTDVLAGGDTTGFARAIERREFVFPADHGPHDGFKTEWWYYTGNLASPTGERFGFQLTFFRLAFTPDEQTGDSEWRTRYAFMGHFGVSDIARGRHVAFERFDRAAKGLAGARPEPFRVWLGDWRAAASGPPGRDGVPDMKLSAAEDGIGIRLRLENKKPPVLQGDDGLSQKGSSPGNASYYYSLTRMTATGTVTLPGGEFEVEGTAWMDREWSTSALEANQSGWDWFALQLDDGADVMYYQMRLRDGTPDTTSRGVIVDPEGKHADISFSETRLDVLDHWESPNGGVYPSKWRLRSESHGIDLTVTPLIDDQELDVSFRYWEGAVDVTGTRRGRPVGGVGFVELTGYTE